MLPDKNIFYVFPTKAYVKYVTKWAGPYNGQNWNKIGGGPLDDATYQISRL